VQQLAVVAVQIALGTHRDRLAVLQKIPAALLAALQVEGQAVVGLQVVQGPGLAVLAEIGRRAADHALVGGELDGHEVGVDHVADAQGHVVTVPHQVHHAVGQVERNAHLRVGLEEAAGVRRHMHAAKRRRGRHHQVAARAVAL
jgi:hypothetical protein